MLGWVEGGNLRMDYRFADLDPERLAAYARCVLTFWNGHHDERGFASMHIYHAASGTPVARRRKRLVEIRAKFGAAVADEDSRRLAQDPSSRTPIGELVFRPHRDGL
jgi:hypothetical protein